MSTFCVTDRISETFKRQYSSSNSSEPIGVPETMMPDGLTGNWSVDGVAVVECGKILHLLGLTERPSGEAANSKCENALSTSAAGPTNETSSMYARI